MAYGKKKTKKNESYLKDAKNGMTPIIDGKKSTPKRKKK
jgi:hypothetical protein